MTEPDPARRAAAEQLRQVLHDDVGFDLWEDDPEKNQATWDRALTYIEATLATEAARVQAAILERVEAVIADHLDEPYASRWQQELIAELRRALAPAPEPETQEVSAFTAYEHEETGLGRMMREQRKSEPK
jgi:hypothetical protein